MESWSRDGPGRNWQRHRVDNGKHSERGVRRTSRKWREGLSSLFTCQGSFTAASRSCGTGTPAGSVHGSSSRGLSNVMYVSNLEWKSLEQNSESFKGRYPVFGSHTHTHTHTHIMVFLSIRIQSLIMETTLSGSTPRAWTLTSSHSQTHPAYTTTRQAEAAAFSLTSGTTLRTPRNWLSRRAAIFAHSPAAGKSWRCC